MAWAIRTATDYKDCLDQIRQFTQKTFKAGAVTAGTNTGTGIVYGASASENSVAETWTIECTAGGGKGVALFSVTGSESGVKATATAGAPYSIAEVSFVITWGDAEFIIGDSFTFDVAASTAEWVQDRWDTDYDGNGGYELIQHGIGAGTDEIYAGYNTKTDNSTYWNLLNTGLTGYVAGNGMEDQFGYHPYYDCMNNTAFSVYFIFTSRHIKIIPLLGAPAAIQGGSYTGFMLPLALPSQWNYPMFVGGSAALVNQRAGDDVDSHSTYWAAGGLGHLNDPESTCAVFDSTTARAISFFSPKSYYAEQWRPSVQGKMLLYPLTPVHEDSNNVYGNLEGVYFPTQFIVGGGNLTSGNILKETPVGGDTDVVAVVFIDVNRSDAGEMIAMDLIGD